ncbi:hypothetical protein DS2_02368 [Catenovulum agarivorans DS-2]|uniref:Lcl C-terminal domain-containing protein n=1 Tax=Catenovulum agarivorans DS-2 TaxID=1328313 RepID=W7QJC7_9ALTE|nr:DUF1566 domain-containing protein [Catenovulum agarivorans]EWH11991.1 hypothetical protein DS2_02368 [Catenovulum agarivorans DS-2]
MLKNFNLIILSTLLMVPITSWAFCSEDVATTVDVTQYAVDSENGLATDPSTGLMWQMCNYGETWQASGARCDGVAKSLDWQQALQASEQVSIAGYDDWRLPNIKELMQIIERSCAEPATQTALFPSMKNEVYWSSTPVFNNGADNLVWTVHFKEGSNAQKQKNNFNFVRLVRKVTQ